MAECDYCGEDFEDENELHFHWGEEHEDELNSHEKEKVKKARRKKEEEEKADLRKKKKYAGYGLGAALVLILVGFVGAQLIQTGGGSKTNFDLEGQPMLGEESAPVTVVEFGDYRCPYCQQFELGVVDQLKDEYIDTGDVKFYFVNFAFLGSGSTQAAVASECVYDQDPEQFWDYHKSIYENQGPESESWVNTDMLVQLARDNTNGLDYEKLRTCIANQETIGEVNQDKQIGQSKGVTSTPSVYVNGEKVANWQYSGLSQKIDQALQE